LSEVSKNAAFLTVESCFTASRTGMVDDHLLSAVHQYIFSILAAAVTKRDVVPPIRDRTTRPTVVRRRSILGVKQRDVGVCFHDHGLPRDLVHNFTGFDYLRGHFFVSHRSVCSTGSAVLGFLTQTIKALRFFATSVAVQQSTPMLHAPGLRRSATQVAGPHISPPYSVLKPAWFVAILLGFCF
jgi:hypothetical protein